MKRNSTSNPAVQTTAEKPRDILTIRTAELGRLLTPKIESQLYVTPKPEEIEFIAEELQVKARLMVADLSDGELNRMHNAFIKKSKAAAKAAEQEAKTTA